MSLGEAAPWTYLNTQKNIHDPFQASRNSYTKTTKKRRYQEKKGWIKDRVQERTHKKRTEKHVLVPRSSPHIIQVDFTGRFPGIHPRGSWIDRDRKWKYEWPLYPNSIWFFTFLSWVNHSPASGGRWSAVYIDCGRVERRPTVSPAEFQLWFFVLTVCSFLVPGKITLCKWGYSSVTIKAENPNKEHFYINGLPRSDI